MSQNFDYVPDTDNGANSGGGSGGSKSPGGGVSLPSTNPSGTGNAETTDFGDCTDSHWAYEYVSELKNKKIINGYEDGNFHPDEYVTREEYVKLIIAATGLYSSNAECDFSDVSKDDWCYKFVASAVQKEIVKGVSDTEFGTGMFITREDAAVIAARTLSMFNQNVSASQSGFADEEQISDYAKEDVNLLAQMGIINGFEDGRFAPADNITRAQAAKIIAMLRNKI